MSHSTSRSDVASGDRASSDRTGTLLSSSNAPLVTAGVALLAVLAGLFVALQPLLGIALVATGVGVLVLWLRPDLGTPAALFVLASNVAVVATRFHGAPRVFGAVFLVLLVPAVLQRVLVQRRSLQLPPVLALLCLTFVVQMLGVAFARAPHRALDELVTYAVEGVLLFLLLSNAVSTESALRRTVWGLVLGGALIGAAPALQAITWTFENDYGGLAQISAGNVKPPYVRMPRSSGPIGDTNRYAQVMLLLLPFGVLAFANERAKRLRVLAALCTAAIGAGFVLAASRGAAVGLVLVLCTLPALGVLSLRKLAWILLAGGLVLLASPRYRGRIASIASMPNLFKTEVTEQDRPDGAVRGRATEMIAAAQVFVDHPWIGVGPGMFPLYSQEYGNRLGIRRLESEREAHSLYLDLAAESGVLGLGLFLATAGLTIARLLAVRRRCVLVRPDLANAGTAVFASLVAYLATGVFLHFSFQRYWFLVLALAWVVIEAMERALSPPAAPADARRPARFAAPGTREVGA